MTAPPASFPIRCGRSWSWVLLAVLVALPYLAVLHGDFLWDDDSHVTENPVVIGPLGWKEMWTTPAANYFPLVLTSFRLQHVLWGLSPFGYHAVTLACHALAAVLLWRLLERLKVRGAWLGAALWALHPVQVESVAWISELKNTQSAVFFLLAVWFFLAWLARESGASSGSAWTAYVLAVGCALGAVLSKPSTVMLPLVIGACAWRFRSDVPLRRLLLALSPFCALAFLAAGWTIWEQAVHSGASGEEWNLGPIERLLMAGCALVFYLGKLLWPADLVFIYPRWLVDPSSLLLYLPLFGVIVLAIWLWRGRDGRRSAPGWAFGFYSALLFPVLGFFNVYFFRYSYVADHFQYLASMGPLAFAGFVISGLASVPRRLASAFLLAALGTLTWQHSLAFANNETLWRSTLARNASAPMAWTNLAFSLARQGRETEAIECLRRVASLAPESAGAHRDAGWAMLKAGYAAAAVPLLERALQLDPNSFEGHNSLGNALRRLGQRDAAIPHYARALELRPESVDAHSNFGSACAEAGDLKQAITHFEIAVRLSPAYAPAYANLGTALGLAGRWSDAISPLRETLSLQPGYPDADEKLGVALANSGQFQEALAHFDRALQLKPNSEPARVGRTRMLQLLGTADHQAGFTAPAETRK